MSAVQVKNALIKAMTEIKTAILDGGSMRLYQNDYTPTAATTLADLTEADFTGYAAVTLTTWSGVYLTAAGYAAVNSPLASFRPVAPFTVGNQIYGIFIRDVAGALVLAQRFDDPVSMVDGNGLLDLIYRYSWGNVGG